MRQTPETLVHRVERGVMGPRARGMAVTRARVLRPGELPLSSILATRSDAMRSAAHVGAPSSGRYPAAPVSIDDRAPLERAARASMGHAREAALLVFALALLTTRGLDTGDAAVHLDLAASLVERGDARLSIDPGSLWVPSRPIAGGLFYQGSDGLRSASAPGLALLAAPFIAMSRVISSESLALDPLFTDDDPRAVIRPIQRDPRVIAFVLIGPICAALAVAFVVLAAKELALSRSATLATVAALALGSPLLAYAGTTWTQLPTTAALAFVLYGLCAREARSSARVRWLSIASALAILVRPDHVFFVVVAGAVLYRIDRGWRRSPSPSMARLLVPTAIAAGVLAWWGIPESGDGWAIERAPLGLAGLLASPRTGLVVYAPFVALVPFGLARLRERHAPIAWLVIGWTAVALLVYSGWFDWPASLAYGPRFLVPILPALALAFGVAFDALSARGRALAMVLVVLGFALELPGALLVHARIDEPDRFFHPTFVSAWTELTAIDRAVGEGVDSVSTYVLAYPVLALAVATMGLLASIRVPR